MKFKLLYCLLILCHPLQADDAWSLVSPDGRLRTELSLDSAGHAEFRIFRDGQPVIERSPLGIDFERSQFSSGLVPWNEAELVPVAETYRLWTGKRKNVDYRANQLRVPLHNPDGEVMMINLRLSNDGLGYRYEFPGEPRGRIRVTGERSGVDFFEDTRAWLQPKANAQTGWKNTNPSYEEDYMQEVPVGTPSPTESGWVYPALFRYADNWILLSEAGMDGRYCATNLAQDSEGGLYRVRFPQAGETTTGGALPPEGERPFHTPWRIVLVGDLSTIVQSTLGTDLADPLKLKDTAFIQPGIAAWSWGLLKDESVVYPVQEQFVDFAAGMNWPYILIDVNWDQNIGFERMAELAQYADSRSVALLLWYNSSGAWNETDYTPKSKLLNREDRRAEFSKLKEMGIRGVKVDFFAGDGMSVIRYYRDILEDAADFGLVVNTHGSTLPRGLQRTYPNYLTSEAIKGFEFITFEQQNADREATHSAMLPFTRNAFDPMDFTPTVLGDIPNIQRRTSNGFQLALPILFYSGIQHLVTTPEQMDAQPDFVRHYLRNIPAIWDESRLVEGFPGRHAVIARRSGQRWYVAGINAEKTPRTFRLDLDFSGQSQGTLIADGENWRSPSKSPYKVGETEIKLPHGTGFVIILDQ